jgi:hypothetical protein
MLIGARGFQASIQAFSGESQKKLVLCRILLSDEMARCTNQVDGFVAAFGFHLPHHAPDVILYGKFREIQAGGNFLVREALSDQMHQLELAVRQVILVNSYTAAIFWFQSVFACNMLNQR